MKPWVKYFFFSFLLLNFQQNLVAETFSAPKPPFELQDTTLSTISNFYGSGLTWQQYLYFFYSTPLSHNWQLGFDFIGDVFGSESPGEIPVEFGLHLKSLWVSQSNENPLANAEYVFFSISAYNNLPLRQGIRPMLSFGLGKYWRPFTNLPLGGDFAIRLSRVFFGFLRTETSELKSTQFSARFSLFFLTEKTLFWL